MIRCRVKTLVRRLSFKFNGFSKNRSGTYVDILSTRVFTNRTLRLSLLYCLEPDSTRDILLL